MWDIGKGKLMFMKWYVGSFVARVGLDKLFGSLPEI